VTPLSPSVRVLVVDDDRSIRDVLTRALIKRGFAVTSASSGAEALEQLKAARFGLMLLDVRMPPGTNGVDLLPLALDLDPALPIIMLTAVSDLTTAARCMQLGARDFLTKPIDLEGLGTAIDKTLGDQAPKT
jgi:two-component system nitrogen regulation response regulator GlnG